MTPEAPARCSRRREWRRFPGSYAFSFHVRSPAAVLGRNGKVAERQGRIEQKSRAMHPRAREADASAVRGQGESGAPSLQEMLEQVRPYDPQPVPARLIVTESLAAGGLLLVAILLAILGPSGRHVGPLELAGLIVAYAALYNVRLYISSGSVVPTELVFVVMVFTLPVAWVPLAVVAATTTGAMVEAGLGRLPRSRVVPAMNDGWYALGPVAVLLAAGQPTAVAAALPVLGGALLAQWAVDIVAATAREWLGKGTPPAVHVRAMAAVCGVDAALAAVAVLAARDMRHTWLLLLPLGALFAALARDRQTQIEAAVQRLDEVNRERARLGRAVHRVGEAFASRLDPRALLDLLVDTAVEAVDAERGRARVPGTTTVGTPGGEGLDAVLRRAEEAVADGGGAHASSGEAQAAACRTAR